MSSETVSLCITLALQIRAVPPVFLEPNRLGRNEDEANAYSFFAKEDGFRRGKGVRH